MSESENYFNWTKQSSEIEIRDIKLEIFDENNNNTTLAKFNGEQIDSLRKVSSQEIGLIKSKRKPLGTLSTNTIVANNSQKQYEFDFDGDDDDGTILGIPSKKRKNILASQESNVDCIILVDSDAESNNESETIRSKKLCVNPTKLKTEYAVPKKTSTNNKRSFNLFKEEEDDDNEQPSSPKTRASSLLSNNLITLDDDDELPDLSSPIKSFGQRGTSNLFSRNYDDELPDLDDIDDISSKQPKSTKSVTKNLKRKNKSFFESDEEDSLSRSNKNKSKAKEKKHKTSYEAHCSKDDEDDAFPNYNQSSKKRRTNNRYCEDEYDMNDSFIDDEEDNDSAVSRKKFKKKNQEEESYPDKESLSEANDQSSVYLAQHRAVLEKQKKPQGYNTDNIGEDLEFKEKLNRIDQTRNPVKEEMIQNLKQEPSVAIDPNNPALLSEPIEDEGEELSPVETFIAYKPKKLTFGLPHPDLVVETTSLASVDPPDLKYRMKLPEEIYMTKKLSSLQLEALIYCCQTHENMLGNGERRGFLLGDGAGVGKGRTIAGIIFENILNNRTKAIWLSVSSDLIVDTRRDMNDVGINTNFNLINIKDMSYKPIRETRAVLFGTYRSLVSKKRKPAYGEYSTRLEQIIAWCGSNFDGVLVFDESHKAKNLVPEKGTKPTKIGEAVRDIQKRLPKARVVYASATGASDCKNMAYMSRLGLWGSVESPFGTLPEFIDFIGESGVTAMEVVALDLKWQGIFTARQLSFDGATFEIRNVELDQNHVDVYNRSVELWTQIFKYMKMSLPLKNESSDSNEMMQFWAYHQRFFRYLCIAAKIDETVRITREAVKAGNCVVIGLQMTGESQSVKQTTKDLYSDEIYSTAFGSLSDMVKRMPDIHEIEKKWDSDEDFYIPNYNSSTGTIRHLNENGVLENISLDQFTLDLKILYKSIRQELNDLKNLLPANSLDKLINDLGGPSKVAEMTGRKMTTVCNQYDNSDDESDSDDDKENKSRRTKKTYTFQKREANDINKVNIEERNKFMNGQKMIAIISDASSAGISLQALKGCKNQRRRLHITLELPWSADKAVQQFGRTHRSNQVQAPDYLLLISKLAGENRFASSVAKRIESMNAITNADRNATKTRDLNCFNIEHTIGNRVAMQVISSIMHLSFLDNVNVPLNYSRGQFLTEARDALTNVDLMTVDKKFPVKTFLNRLLGCPVEIQNAIYEYFGSALENEIILAKREGRYDNGVENVDFSLKDIINITNDRFSLKDNRMIYFKTFEIKNGMNFKEAFGIFERNNVTGNINGFYYRRYGWNAQIPHLAIKSSTGHHKYIMFSPHNGKESRRLTETELKNEYKKVAISEDFAQCKHLPTVKTAWNHFYEKTLTHEYHILSGSILTVFLKVRMLFAGLNAKKKEGEQRFQMVRVNLGNNNRVIGIKLPNVYWIDKVKRAISEKSDNNNLTE